MSQKIKTIKCVSLMLIAFVTYFGKSKKYQKNGILVVVLRGEPYEIGYTRGCPLTGRNQGMG